MGQINKKRKRNNGFTLVELICVIAIMAILIAVAVPSYQNMQNKSAEQVALSNARSEYSAGKAQQALVDAQVLKPNETEAYNYDSGTDTATWEGEINGRTYTATFDGKSGEGTVNYK
ncbi:MAG: type II secretion system GspH family protein [Clostridium sp.]|nr:type II secretion system GspH family protein [Clostridium sp.]